jgi:undecaprenyl-diphosphatase
MGTFQALALLPGVSRSGTTISSGVFRRIRPDVATRFSFLLGIPAIGGALVLEGKDVAALPADLRMPLALGVATAYVTGFAAIGLLLRMVRTGKLQYFAYYCWALGILVAAAAMIGVA